MLFLPVGWHVLSLCFVAVVAGPGKPRPWTWDLAAHRQEQRHPLATEHRTLQAVNEARDAVDDANATKGEGSGDPECSAAVKLEHEEAEDQRLEVLMVVAFSMLGLLVVFCAGFLLESYHIVWIPEAGIGIAVGLAISIIAKLCLTEHIASMLRFDPQFFFVVLLPPIMFEAGYNMQRKAFFRNIVAICSYAFLGTAISCFAVGGMVYYAGQWGWCRPIGGLAALVFGAIISATDPVTTLAVFKQLKADVHLYSLVFGESALNDAVAIVLYRTLIQFQCGWSVGEIGTAVGTFLIIFLMSTIIGTCVAVLSALLTKHCHMRHHPDFLFGELAVICCFPYLAFTLAEGVGFSGIVAILFCGVGMAHYTANNISLRASEISCHFFKLLAKLSETFVFIYLGQAVFTFNMNYRQFLFVGVAFAACLVARALNVYPISLAINLFRRKADRISQRCQFVIWFGGLRGAVAFLLAVQSWGRNDFPEVSEPKYPGFTDSDCILNTTLFIAILSVFTMGGPVGPMMKCFKLTSNLEEEPDEAEIPAQQPSVGTYHYVDRKIIKPFLTIHQWDVNTGEQGSMLSLRARPVDERTPHAVSTHASMCVYINEEPPGNQDGVEIVADIGELENQEKSIIKVRLWQDHFFVSTKKMHN